MPTCPEWTVRDLVAHQGMVHRWATALVRGERPTDEEVAAYETAGAAAADPLAWLGDGAAELARSITDAPDGPRGAGLPERRAAGPGFWARRQCHETTIHAVDAMAASLGRPPRPDEVWVDPDLAGDGIDELLGGFLTRPRSRLRCDEDALLVVTPGRPDGLVGGRAWVRGPPSPRGVRPATSRRTTPTGS